MVRRGLLLLFITVAAQAGSFYPPQLGSGGATTAPAAISNARMALVVWGDPVHCDGLCAVRFSADGVLLDEGPRAIAGSPGARLLAMATDGETFLTAQATGGDVLLVKVEADGTSHTIARRGQVNGIALAWDGASYVVAEAYSQMVQLARIRPDGALVSSRFLSFRGASRIVAAANANGTVVISWDPMDLFVRDLEAEKVLMRYLAPFPNALLTDGRGFLSGRNLLDESAYSIGTLPSGGLSGTLAWSGREYVALDTRGNDLLVGPAGTKTPTVLSLPHTRGGLLSGTAMARLAGDKLLLVWETSYYSGFEDAIATAVSVGVFDRTTLSSVRTISTAPAQQLDATTVTCGDTAVVAWVERSNTTRVRVGRVRRDGALADHDSFAVDPNVTDEVTQTEPVAACNASSFAVTWKERTSATSTVTLKMAVFPSATPEVHRVLVISPDAFPRRLTGLASDGQHYLVAWSDASDPNLAGLRVTSEGFAADPPFTFLTSSGGNAGAALRWDGTRYVLVWARLAGPLRHFEFRFARLTPELSMDGEATDVTGLAGLIEWPADARFSVAQTADGWFVRDYASRDEARLWLGRTGAVKRTYVTRFVTRTGADNVSTAFDGWSVLTIDHGTITARDLGDRAFTTVFFDPVVALADFRTLPPLVITSHGPALVVLPVPAHLRAVR